MVTLSHSTDYAGDLGCKAAYDLLADDAKAQLIDVRTQAEWNFVGVPDLTALGRAAIFVEWQSFPGGQINARFVAEVEDALARAGAAADAPLLLLCRSGGRSAAAASALTAAGFGPCYNLAGGFEGDLDHNRHRSALRGWKAEGLPWVQG